MRKRCVPLLAVIFLLAAACSRTPAAPAATATPAPTGDLDVLAASDTDTALAQAHTPPASATDADTVVNSEIFQQAYSFIGRPAAEMVATIGTPPQPIEYTPSAIQEGAMDGTYRYDGFVVVSLHTDSWEIVQSVTPAAAAAASANG